MRTLLGAGAGLALEEAIPFNRVWFFPKRIRIARFSATYRINFSDDCFALSLEEFSQKFLRPAIHHMFEQAEKDMTFLQADTWELPAIHRSYGMFRVMPSS